MLFGIERKRGRASKNDTYSKFQPWTQSGVYEGYLRVECDGQIYRIERRFQKGDKRLCVINETTGKEEENNKALWDKLRCGLSETAYDNTISIGQLKCATDGGMVSELRNYIANLNTSGSIALNITKASAYLKAQRKQLEARFVPEAAKSYTAALSEIRRIEQEISAPEYANHLTAKRQERGLVRAVKIWEPDWITGRSRFPGPAGRTNCFQSQALPGTSVKMPLRIWNAYCRQLLHWHDLQNAVWSHCGTFLQMPGL